MKVQTLLLKSFSDDSNDDFLDLLSKSRSDISDYLMFSSWFLNEVASNH